MSMIGKFCSADTETVRRVQEGDLSLEALLSGEGDRALDVDKTWEAMRNVLMSLDEKDGVLWRAVYGERMLSEEVISYSPAFLAIPEEVKEVSEALGRVDEAQFRANFDVRQMYENHIYPVTEDEDDEEFFAYVWDYLKQLQDFYRRAAEEGRCVLFWID